MASEVSFKNLISLTSAGLRVATYPEIVEFLTIRYKEAYGDDIKLTNTSADGVFIHNTALEINNILQTMSLMYSSLNINEATGVSLDNLCALSNIFRKQETNSTASVTITNLGSTDYIFKIVEAVDKVGVMWKYTSSTDVTLQAGASMIITLTCEEKGAIEAPVGWIYQITNLPNNYIVNIEQSVPAIKGENIESDRDLRARKNQSNSPVGMTVLESLVGALLQIEGVRDALIYNNADGSLSTADDRTSIPIHDIYIILRQSPLVNDNDIAQVIFNKLTPGVMTTESGDSDSTTHKFVRYFPAIFGLNNTAYSTNVYWKNAKPVNPKIEITFTNVNQYFDENLAVGILGKGLIDYLNNLQLSTNITEDDLKIQTYSLDPKYTGLYDFTVNSVTIASATSGVYLNADTYYNYTTATLSGNILTIQ